MAAPTVEEIQGAVETDNSVKLADIAAATSDANALAGLINDLGTVVDGLAASLAALDAAVTAIKGKTDNLGFTVAGHVDANTKSLNDALLDGDGTDGNKWRPA